MSTKRGRRRVFVKAERFVGVGSRRLARSSIETEINTPIKTTKEGSTCSLLRMKRNKKGGITRQASTVGKKKGRIEQ